LTARLRVLEHQLEKRLHPCEETLVRLEEITGVSRRILSVLFAEVGTDMSRFPDAAHKRVLGRHVSRSA
jgi:hypothetical protein